MNIGFIGAGNMAGALIRGFVKNGVAPKSIFAFNRSPKKAERLRDECGVNASVSSKDILDNCRIVVLAVKPNLTADVLKSMKVSLDKDKHIIVSIAAGISISMIESFAETSGMPVIRVMSNINVSIGEGTTAFCRNAYVTDSDYAYAVDLFSSVGKAFELEERLFDVFGALAGSSPAFTYLFIESLAKAAHKAGMSKEIAVEIAAQAVAGSAKMLLNSKKHPWELIDMVCSPGGTTIEGICSLEENGFSPSVVKCLDACIKKDRAVASDNGRDRIN